MEPVVHFEMPYDDRDRIVKFYRDVFGWEMNLLGEEMGNYVLVKTAEPEQRVRHAAAYGAIGGGFYQRDADRPAQYPSVVVGVEDVRASMKKIVAAGGQVLGEPVNIPGSGQYVSFFDTEMNRVSMLQPQMPG